MLARASTSVLTVINLEGASTIVSVYSVQTVQGATVSSSWTVQKLQREHVTVLEGASVYVCLYVCNWNGGCKCVCA